VSVIRKFAHLCVAVCAVCCSALQCVAVCVRVWRRRVMQTLAQLCWSMLECVAVRFGEVQCVAVHCNV